MANAKPIICVKCGSAVVAEDRAMAHQPPVPTWVLESSARFVATCSNRNQATGREHGIGEGPTEEAALAAYAKDQAWGMEQLEKLAAYEELEQGLKGAAKKLWESI